MDTETEVTIGEMYVGGSTKYYSKMEYKTSYTGITLMNCP